jgi:hypothetical protein
LEKIKERSYNKGMNIFVTDDDPIVSTYNLCDQHVRSKMQIEGAIMLAHAFPQEVLDHPSTPRTSTGKPRRRGKGYFNHQCSIWARETKDNFKWLVDHTLEMFTERMYRWPESNEHFTKTFIEWCGKNIHNTIMSKTGLTSYAVAISDDCDCRRVKDFDNLSTIDKYREYIRHDKDFATWTLRWRPTWY